MGGIPPIAPYPMPGSGQLPGNRASWTVRSDRAVLLIHDMQRYFLQPFGEAFRTRLVQTTAALRRRCASRGIPIAYTAQPGGMSAAQRGLLQEFWGPGMRTDPDDRAIVDPLAPGASDWLFTKWRYSAFFGSGLLERMREHGRDQLVLCGVYAHIGVLMTAVDAFSNDIETFLVADAVADFTAENHRSAIDYAARCCAVVATAEEVVA
ncbi:isochorismatase family protein [Nocardiopsis coralliicola]